MPVKSDRWIREMAQRHGMIEPFEVGQVREGRISYGLSSFGYDISVAPEFKVFTNIHSAIVDPKQFDERSFVDQAGESCIIPPNAFALARTEPDAPKPRGISFFLIDMNTPGITVRPLVNMADRHHFNEVFFEDVRVPKSNVVGEVNRGWYHLAVALDFERSGIGAFAGSRRTVEEITQFAADEPQYLQRRPGVRYELAERQIEVEVGTCMAYRIAYMQERGVVAHHEDSMSKLFGSELNQRVAKTGVDLLGLHGGIWDESPHAALHGRLAKSYVGAVSSTIAAGTSEIQRNIIATRGLGLPRA